MDDRKREPLILPTHTSLWHVEKRLYKIYDATLPFAISFRQAGFFLGFTIPWFALMTLLNVPFDAPWHVLWLAPPGIVTWLASKPIAEGKRLGELLSSQVRFLLQAKRYSGLRPNDEPARYRATARVWVHDPPPDGTTGRPGLPVTPST